MLVAVLAATAMGIAALFRLRLGRGDIFPEYSSLRSDPLGTRAFCDALSELPELSVERQFQPLESITAGVPRTVIVAGLLPEHWRHLPKKEFSALDRAAHGGSRVVLLLRSEFGPVEREDGADESSGDRPDGPAAEKPKAAAKPAETADLKRLWGVDLATRVQMDNEKDAVLEPHAPQGLPPALRWHSGAYFKIEGGADWRVVYRDMGRPVLMERRIGRGSIVVGTDAYFLSNEALLTDRATRLLSWIVGPNTRVDFDESHLGVVDGVGVARLARRYGLEWAFATFFLLALLFVWRSMTLFVPPSQEVSEVSLSFSPTAALEALLLRSVPQEDLFAVCLSEWRRTARAPDSPQLKAALGPAEGIPAETAYNATVQALRRK
jgi:hypothetical protein